MYHAWYIQDEASLEEVLTERVLMAVKALVKHQSDPSCIIIDFYVH